MYLILETYYCDLFLTLCDLSPYKRLINNLQKALLYCFIMYLEELR
jgi:hypothetical protein